MLVRIIPNRLNYCRRTKFRVIRMGCEQHGVGIGYIDSYGIYAGNHQRSGGIGYERNYVPLKEVKICNVHSVFPIT